MSDIGNVIDTGICMQILGIGAKTGGSSRCNSQRWIVHVLVLLTKSGFSSSAAVCSPPCFRKWEESKTTAAGRLTWFGGWAWETTVVCTIWFSLHCCQYSGFYVLLFFSCFKNCYKVSGDFKNCVVHIVMWNHSLADQRNYTEKNNNKQQNVDKVQKYKITSSGSEIF